MTRPAGPGETATPVAVPTRHGAPGDDATCHDLVELLDHELRTPLTSVVGYVELLLDGAAGPLGEAQAEMLQRVAISSARLSSAVEQVLDVCHRSTASDEGPDLAAVLGALGAGARRDSSGAAPAARPVARRFVTVPAGRQREGRPTLVR